MGFLDCEIERYDLISDQIEKMKKIVLNIIILMKNLHRVNEYKYYIQTIRLLSIEINDVFQNYKRLCDMKIIRLQNDEIDYINATLSNFNNMIFHNFK